MPLPPIQPLKSSSLPPEPNTDQRKSPLHSSWIRRLRPDHPPPPPPHSSIPIPLHPPTPRLQRDEGGFGPFGRVKPRPNHRPAVESGEAPFSLYRRRLSNVLRPSQELFHGFPSPTACEQDDNVDGGFAVDRGTGSSSVQYGSRRGGSGAGEEADGVAARRNFWNPHAFNLCTANQRRQRQNHSYSSEPEEPFSYWNMGRLRGTNFVSAVCPVSLLTTVDHGRKRTANTYGFNVSKFRRFHYKD